MQHKNEFNCKGKGDNMCINEKQLYDADEMLCLHNNPAFKIKINLIKYLGIKPALWITYILPIATQKNPFTIEKKQIKKNTTLTLREQTKIIEMLKNKNILTIHPKNSTEKTEKYELNLKKIINILTKE